MSTIGQIEKKTQARVVALFREQLGYDYLGYWIDREGNRNIEEAHLRPFLKARGHDDALISRALYHLKRRAADQSRSLYDLNRSVYDLLRYGVKVKAEVGENTQTVWLIDWANPEANHFAIAEEVTVSPRVRTARRPTQAPGHRALRQRHRARRAGAEALDGLGGRGHPPEPRQPEEDLHPALLHHRAAVMAGNDTEGLRYGVDRDAGEVLSDLEGAERRSRTRSIAALLQLCNKQRFLELIHDFIVFDAGIKKTLPPQPVLRRAGRPGACEAPRGRHHLAHPGLGQEPDDGLAGEVDPRARQRTPAS